MPSDDHEFLSDILSYSSMRHNTAVGVFFVALLKKMGLEKVL
jgi:hypothetical protein